MTLTPKQEKFAQGVASGMSQADAYRHAYNAEKMKPETIQKRASELMSKGEISGRVRELQEEGAKIAVYTLAEHLSRLDKLSRGAESEGKYAEAVKAEELRGKAVGFYTERQQIDHTTNGESIQPQVIEIVTPKITD
jgi:phage terminase small subunit